MYTHTIHIFVNRLRLCHLTCIGRLTFPSYPDWGFGCPIVVQKWTLACWPFTSSVVQVVCYFTLILRAQIWSLAIDGVTVQDSLLCHYSFSVYKQHESFSGLIKSLVIYSNLLSFALAFFLKYSAKLKDRKTRGIENTIKALIHSKPWVYFFPPLYLYCKTCTIKLIVVFQFHWGMLVQREKNGIYILSNKKRKKL